MNCACVDIDEGQHAEFHARDIRVARKIHVCAECHRAIGIGERYEVVIGKWPDVGFITHKTCIDCLSIRDVFFCNRYSYGDIRADLCDLLREIDGDITDDQIGRLTPSARKFVIERLDAIWRVRKEKSWA